MTHPLETWRKQQKGTRITRNALGKLIGVSEVEVYRYERGKCRIPAEKVDQITRLTGIPPHKLRPDIFLPLKMDVSTEG